MDKQYIYYTIEKQGLAEFKAGGSKFIGYAFPVKDVEACRLHLAELKKEHSKATHHCFAYRIGLDGNNFRVNDDGEPSGSAGRPILGQIDSRDLTNIQVIVIRYFGGTLLGLPGLTNAYKSVTALVLQTTAIIQRVEAEDFFIQFDYTQLHEVMSLIKKYNCLITMQNNELFCKIRLEIPKDRLQELSYHLNELRDVELTKAL